MLQYQLTSWMCNHRFLLILGPCIQVWMTVLTVEFLLEAPGCLLESGSPGFLRVLPNLSVNDQMPVAAKGEECPLCQCIRALVLSNGDAWCQVAWSLVLGGTSPGGLPFSRWFWRFTWPS